MTFQVVDLMVGWEGVEPSTSGLKARPPEHSYLYESVGLSAGNLFPINARIGLNSVSSDHGRRRIRNRKDGLATLRLGERAS